MRMVTQKVEPWPTSLITPHLAAHVFGQAFHDGKAQARAAVMAAWWRKSICEKF